jgi:hypothetical protein
MTGSQPKDGIERRDFLNGILMAAGGAAISGFSPMRAWAHSSQDVESSPAIESAIASGLRTTDEVLPLI